jgi:hypothetical protein
LFFFSNPRICFSSKDADFSQLYIIWHLHCISVKS